MQKITIGAASAVSETSMRFALESRVYTQWADSLAPEFGLTGVTFQAVDFKGQPSAETVMFVRLLAKTHKPFEEVVELRGSTVVLLPIFICDGIEYTVLTVQPRLPAGTFEFVEVPAGMVDNSTFRGAAAKELQEELGIVYHDSELIDLTNRSGKRGGIYFSPGLLDEQARFYAAIRNVTREELLAMQGRATGVLEEGEQITLSVVQLDDVLDQSRDGKTFIALSLYQLWKEYK